MNANLEQSVSRMTNVVVGILTLGVGYWALVMAARSLAGFF